MRADRLLRLLMLLQRHQRATATWLADELEVSARTVLRDMEALSTAGVPVYTERGRGGGCVLLEGFTTEATGLTPPEAQALFAWASRESVAQLGLGGDLGSALAKIAATAPPQALERAEALGDVVLADRRRWFAAGDDVPWLPLLREASTARRQVRLSYASAGSTEPSSRTVHPVGLVDHSGRWYLVAEHRRRPRTYRVSRVQSATMLDRGVQLVDQRPLRERWTDLRQNFEERLSPIDVTVEVAPQAAEEVRRLLSMQLAPGTQIDVLPATTRNGWETWRLALMRPSVLAAVAVLLAEDMVVREPTSIVRGIRAGAQRALHVYPSG